MITVIAGSKGAGKTKQLISQCNETSGRSPGSVVCVERGQKLKYDIRRETRLIDAVPYGIDGYPMLKGFVTGLCAGNYDISDIFIDSLMKVSGDADTGACECFLQWCEQFSAANKISFFITISIAESDIPDGVRKYMNA